MNGILKVSDKEMNGILKVSDKEMLIQKLRNIYGRLETDRNTLVNGMNDDLEKNNYKEGYIFQLRRKVNEAYDIQVQKAKEEAKRLISDYVGKNKIQKNAININELMQITELYNKSGLSDGDLKILLGDKVNDLMFMELLEKQGIHPFENTETFESYLNMKSKNESLDALLDIDLFGNDLKSNATESYSFNNAIDIIEKTATE